MNIKKIFLTIFIFFLLAAGIVTFSLWPEKEDNGENSYGRHQTRLIIPRFEDDQNQDEFYDDPLNKPEYIELKVPLAEGESIISILNLNSEKYLMDEQFIAYRNLTLGNEIFVTYIAWNRQTGIYERIWNAATLASVPGTVSVYSDDILGDRSPCVIVTGMNVDREHTITIFNKNTGETDDTPFIKIAGIQVDGSITINKVERPLAYRQGIAKGQAYSITAYRHGVETENLLDRVEITYAYNPESRNYESIKTTRVPGTQIEQRRLREILSGDAKTFEEFINDLWYHVGSGGTIDKNQYLYFDHLIREVIFFGDETMQIFTWRSSNSTRYGIYISAQNKSVSTLRRFMDIELESLNSIRVRVNEDVRLKINVSTLWDGSYRRAGSIMQSTSEKKSAHVYTDAVYDSSMGRLQFKSNGEYELSSSGSITKGRYVFFTVEDNDLLELRPENAGDSVNNSTDRLIYRIRAAGKTEKEELLDMENISLSRVRLGIKGIADLQEGQIILTRAR